MKRIKRMDELKIGEKICRIRDNDFSIETFCGYVPGRDNVVIFVDDFNNAYCDTALSKECYLYDETLQSIEDVIHLRIRFYNRLIAKDMEKLYHIQNNHLSDDCL